jgi:hypothetical protein
MNKVMVNIPNRTPVNANISGVSVVESNDYNDLRNRPMINGVLLEGDLTAEDLGINNTVATIEETIQFLGLDS